MMELWDAYNEKREQLGHHLIRGQVILSGQYHLCVHVDFTVGVLSWDPDFQVVGLSS